MTKIIYIFNKINLKSIILSLIILIFFYSCKTNENTYENCIGKWEKETGNRYYLSLEKFEKLLISKNFLKTKDKKDYAVLIKDILNKNKKLNIFFDSIKQTYLYNEIQDGQFQMVNYCSNITYNEGISNNFKCSSDNIQRYFFKHFIYKSFKDPYLIEGIVMFTNYKNKFSRLNVTYLSFLLMKEFSKKD